MPVVRKSVPFVQKAVKSEVGQDMLKQVKKSALKSSLNLMEDVAQGKNIKESLSENLSKEAEDISRSLAKIGAKAIKRKAETESSRPKKKRRLAKKSIFD